MLCYSSYSFNMVNTQSIYKSVSDSPAMLGSRKCGMPSGDSFRPISLCQSNRWKSLELKHYEQHKGKDDCKHMQRNLESWQSKINNPFTANLCGFNSGWNKYFGSFSDKGDSCCFVISFSTNTGLFLAIYYFV